MSSGFEKYFKNSKKSGPSNSAKSGTSSSGGTHLFPPVRCGSNSLYLTLILTLVLAGGGPKNPKNPKKGKEQGPGSETDFMTVLLDPKNRGSVLALFTSLAIGGVLLLGGESNQREVTWQEFRAKYLDEGKVERIEVVNKTTAKVFVTPESTNSCVLAS